MTAVLILGWMTIAALVLIARVDYRVPPRLTTDATECPRPNRRTPPPRTTTQTVFRAPPLPEPVVADAR